MNDAKDTPAEVVVTVNYNGVCPLCESADGVTLREPQGDVIRLVKNGNAVKIRRSCKKQAEM